jgi:hypothetical protein
MPEVCKTGTQLTPWITAVLINRIVVQLVKKLPSFYGILRFISAFTKGPYWCLVSAR